MRLALWLAILAALLVLSAAAQNWRSGGVTWGSRASVLWAPIAPAWASAGAVNWGGSAHNVVLAWAASSTAGVAYAVFRGPSSSGPWSKIGTTAATTFTDLDAPAGTWWYTVAAVADAGAGPSSANAAAAEAVVP